MYHLTANIEIGQYVFTYCHKVLIESSWQQLTDVCTIELPRQLQFEGKSLKELIQPNMPVLVQLGYDGYLNTEFEGVVSRISPDLPFVVHCQDNMKALKENNVVFASANISLAGLLSAVLPANVVFEADNIQLGAFRVDNASAAKVLDVLKREYGIYSYFREGVLNVGLPPLNQHSVEFGFQNNIVRNNLEYRLEDDVKFKVRCVSMKPDGTKIEVSEGDADGQQRTFHFYDMEEAALKDICQSRLENLKYEGYQGSFQTFGVPFIQHGDVAVMNDLDFPERAGAYRIDKVTTEFGVNGFKRDIQIGIKI